MDLIEKTKQEIALKHGYPNNILGSAWDYAMMLTHRTKKQIELYEELARALVETLSVPQANELLPHVMHHNFRNDMIKVYVASPYTLGDVAVNVKRQLDAVNELMNKGFAPFAPLYSHFQHMVHPRPYQDWINIDMEWVRVCDCVLRLDGESSGADGEVKLAKELNIPVYYSFDELYSAYGA